jgi:putative endonuclease
VFCTDGPDTDATLITDKPHAIHYSLSFRILVTPNSLSFRPTGGTCFSPVPIHMRYHVYILASCSRILYVGVTGCLMARVLRHRTGQGSAFTHKYRVHRLVYTQAFQNIGDAIAREIQIKVGRTTKNSVSFACTTPHGKTWPKVGVSPRPCSSREKQIPPVGRNDNAFNFGREHFRSLCFRTDDPEADVTLITDKLRAVHYSLSSRTFCHSDHREEPAFSRPYRSIRAQPHMGRPV